MVSDLHFLTFNHFLTIFVGVSVEIIMEISWAENQPPMGGTAESRAALENVKGNHHGTTVGDVEGNKPYALALLIVGGDL